jgi:hypothetical protein
MVFLLSDRAMGSTEGLAYARQCPAEFRPSVTNHGGVEDPRRSKGLIRKRAKEDREGVSSCTLQIDPHGRGRGKVYGSPPAFQKQYSLPLAPV